MNILTQEAKKRQAVVECAIKNDNKSYAGRKYGYSRSSVKRWCNLYDGTWQSLVEKSHRPHSHPRQHTEEELKLIRNMRRRNRKLGLTELWYRLKKRGYSRTGLL